MTRSMIAFADHVVRKAQERGIPLMRDDVYESAERYGVVLTDQLWSEVKWSAQARHVDIVN